MLKTINLSEMLKKVTFRHVTSTTCEKTEISYCSVGRHRDIKGAYGLGL